VITPEDAIISVLAVSPGHEVRGKKRIHKIAFLCNYCHAPIAAQFNIRHFGVFSNEIAGALDVLTTFGDLDMHDEQIGPNGYFITVYSLSGKPRHKPDPKVAKVAAALAAYSTPSLEVASTVAYFTMHGLSEAGAMKETRRIKPALSSGAQFAITKRLLNALAEIGAGGDGQR
jgi:hypothetical protein